MNEMDMFSLKGKVIVVTGGTGVLGYSFIKAISGAGAIVGVLGRNEKVANERVKEIIEAGGQAIALIADVQNEAALDVCCIKLSMLLAKLMAWSMQPVEMCPKQFYNLVMIRLK